MKISPGCRKDFLFAWKNSLHNLSLIEREHFSHLFMSKPSIRLFLAHKLAIISAKEFAMLWQR